MMQSKPKSQVNLNQLTKKFVSKLESKNVLLLENEQITYRDFLKNKMLIIQAIQQGIPYDFFNLIKENSPFNESDWSKFLGISTKSLQRNKTKENFVFKALQSEKILELAEVNALGIDVFDSENQYYSWLNTNCFALANLKPIDLLKNSFGKEMVLNELQKIDYGIFV